MAGKASRGAARTPDPADAINLVCNATHLYQNEFDLQQYSPLECCTEAVKKTNKGTGYKSVCPVITKLSTMQVDPEMFSGTVEMNDHVDPSQSSVGTYSLVLEQSPCTQKWMRVARHAFECPVLPVQNLTREQAALVEDSSRTLLPALISSVVRPGAIKNFKTRKANPSIVHQYPLANFVRDAVMNPGVSPSEIKISFGAKKASFSLSKDTRYVEVIIEEKRKDGIACTEYVNMLVAEVTIQCVLQQVGRNIYTSATSRLPCWALLGVFMLPRNAICMIELQKQWEGNALEGPFLPTGCHLSLMFLKCGGSLTEMLLSCTIAMQLC